VVEQARHLLNRAEVQGQPQLEQRIAQLYRLIYGRAPDAEEVALALRFLQTAAERGAEPPGPQGRTLTAWEQYAQVLLLANEFAFVD
jgi:hypothetical protein